jgi:hypothetical protein
MTTEIDIALERLQAVVEERPELYEIGHLYNVILPLLRSADHGTSPLEFTPEQVKSKIARDQPLLQGVNLKFDKWESSSLMAHLTRAVEDTPPGKEISSRFLWIIGDRRKKPRENAPENDDRLLRATAARQIRLMIETGGLDVSLLLQRVGGGDIASVIALAEDLQLDPGLLWTLAHFALKPALYAWREQLQPIAGYGWDVSYCFFCGADALLGEHHSISETIRLRCGQCGASWSVPRSQCIYCHNTDLSTLSELFPKNEADKARLQMCGSCRRYTKIFESPDPASFEMILVQDLKTLYLDIEAEDQGYTRGRRTPDQVFDF